MRDIIQEWTFILKQNHIHRNFTKIQFMSYTIYGAFLR